MNKFHLLRVAAIGVSTAALTFSGASMAVAAEPSVAQSTDRPAGVAPATTQAWSASTAKSARSGPKIQSVSKFSFKSGVLVRKGSNFIPGSVQITDAGVGQQTIVTSEVWINGKNRGYARVYPNGAYILGTAGPGAVKLRNTRVYADGTNLSSYTATASNTFYFRRDTFGSFKVRHSGKKVTMSVKAQVRASNGGRSTAKRAYVQYAKSGKWKHLKRIKLNSSGKGSYKYSTKSKRVYRLVVKKSATVKGMTIKLRKL